MRSAPCSGIRKCQATSKVAILPGASGSARSTFITVPLSRVLSATVRPLRPPKLWSNRVMTSPPTNPRAPKREFCGKMKELSDWSLNAFCSVCIQMKRRVSGELLV